MTNSNPELCEMKSYPIIDGVEPELLMRLYPSDVPDYPETWTHNATYYIKDLDIKFIINMKFTTDTVGPQKWKVMVQSIDEAIGGKTLEFCDTPKEAIKKIEMEINNIR